MDGIFQCRAGRHFHHWLLLLFLAFSDKTLLHPLPVIFIVLTKINMLFALNLMWLCLDLNEIMFILIPKCENFL